MQQFPPELDSGKTAAPPVCIRHGNLFWMGMLSCLAWLLSAPSLGRAQQPHASLRTDVDFSEHLQRNYGSDDGLPSDWVNDILQSRNSFLWIATDNGLVRYDGKSFKLISDPSTLQSPASEVRVLAESDGGTLWVGTTAGLYAYYTQAALPYQAVRSVRDVQVQAVFEGTEGVWVGTSEHTYLRRPGEDFQALEKAPQDVRAICEFEGAMWFGSNRGLFRACDDHYEQIYHDRLPDQSSLSSGVPQTRVNDLFVDKRNELWIGTNRTLLHYRQGAFTDRGHEGEIEAQQVYRIYQTRDETLYIAARFGVYRALADAPFVRVSELDSAFCLTEDHLGGLWVGHGANLGLNRYHNQDARQFWSGERVRCVFSTSNGDLWFGSSVGAHLVRDNSLLELDVQDGLPDPRVTTFIDSRDRGFWIGTARGLAKYEGNKIVANPCAELTAGMNISCGLEDSTGGIWFSLVTNRGFHCAGGKLVELDSLSGGRIHWFWEDKQGAIWIGHAAGLYRVINDRVTAVTDDAIEALSNPRFQCFSEDAQGDLWLGTSNGILRYASGTFTAFPPGCGLLADNIERLAVDDRGRLWFGGRDGLFHVAIEELDRFASGAQAGVTSYRVAGFDRCPPVNAFSQGCLVKDDQLWMVAENSLTTMSLDTARQPERSPVVFIDLVSIDGVAPPSRDEFSYSAGPKRLLVDYAIPALEYREHLHTRFRLEGHDRHWIAGDDSFSAQYSDLRPGDYQFRVMARHGNGKWHESTESIRFRVIPRWWERTWIRVSAISLLLAAVALFSRQRLKRAKRANAELRHEIENRIRAQRESRENQERLARVTRAASMGELSTSIAHEVKQPLFAIVSNAHTVDKLLDCDEPDLLEVREALQDIASDGQRASDIIDRIRGMVKKERPPQQELDLNQVVRDAIKFANPEFQRRHLEVATELAAGIPTVLGDPVELQQVVLNLLINGAQAMEHSSMQRILVRTCAREGQVQVAVRDYGVACDSDKTSQLFEPFFTTKAGGTGMGLAINRTIIEAHGGRIWAQPNSDVGMTFRFELPSSHQAHSEST